MFIAVVGTRLSGKTCTKDFLVSRKGFTLVSLRGHAPQVSEPSINSIPNDTTQKIHQCKNHEPSPFQARHDTNTQLFFSTPNQMLEFVTRHWQDNFVTLDLLARAQIEMFVKRPFFLLISVDAPLYERYKRSNQSYASLDDFVREDDHLVFGAQANDRDPNCSTSASSLHYLRDLIDIQVTNTFPSLRDFDSYLEELNLLDAEHLRPGWDAYFMTLASLASRRSNCMKRRVGAVLVRDKRIIATGYNGTARGLTNCNEGGCPACNKAAASIGAPGECICLHAEENALLEAGRERIGQDAVLYCNTCPCLRCTVKIIQTGLKTVVYNLSYKVDEASAALFKQAGVELRRFNPSKNFNISVPDPSQVGQPNILVPHLALSN